MDNQRAISLHIGNEAKFSPVTLVFSAWSDLNRASNVGHGWVRCSFSVEAGDHHVDGGNDGLYTACLGTLPQQRHGRYVSAKRQF